MVRAGHRPLPEEGPEVGIHVGDVLRDVAVHPQVPVADDFRDLGDDPRLAVHGADGEGAQLARRAPPA